MERQRLHSLRMDKILGDAEDVMIGEIERLSQTQDMTESTVDLIKAARRLSKPDYQKYKARRKVADECLQISADDNGGITIVDITRPATEARHFFQSREDRCNCKDRITEESQCAHEIKLKGGFSEDAHLPRHFRRKKVTTSLLGWQPPSGDVFEEVMGMAMENVEEYDETGATADTPLPVATVAREEALQDLSSNRVGPLSNGIVRGLFNDITSYYDRCPFDVKTLIGGMAIKLRDMVVCVVRTATTLPIDERQASEGQIQSLMQDVIRRYRSAFTDCNDAFSRAVGPETTVGAYYLIALPLATVH